MGAMEIALEPESFDALLFDCDGTLVDTGPLHFQALRTAMQAMRLDIDAAWYYARIGLGPKDLFDAYEAEIAPFPQPRSALQTVYAQTFRDNLATLREIAVVADVARQWHGRVPMAVVSNGQRAIVQATLRVTGLLSMFNCLVCVEDVERGKPAPDPYLAAASCLQVAPARCIVLEDSDEGLHSAHAAGMRGVDIREYFKPRR